MGTTPPRPLLRVAACQWQMRPITTFDDFRQHMAEVLSAAHAAGAQLLMLPEYVTYELLLTVPGAAGFGRAAFDEAFDLFFPTVRAEFVALCQELAARAGLWLLTGSTWHTDAYGRLANSAYLINPAGEVVGVQQKLHLTPPEEEAMGGQTLLITDIGPARVGIAICYDIEFPEVARTLAERGVTLILVPSWTMTPRGANRVRLCAQARCVENGLFVAHAPLLGSIGLPLGEPALRGYGQAAIFGPIEEHLGYADGIVAAAPQSAPDALAVADLDFAGLHLARTCSEAPTWRHRRPELYAAWHQERSQPV